GGTCLIGKKRNVTSVAGKRRIPLHGRRIRQPLQLASGLSSVEGERQRPEGLAELRVRKCDVTSTRARCLHFVPSPCGYSFGNPSGLARGPRDSNSPKVLGAAVAAGKDDFVAGTAPTSRPGNSGHWGEGGLRIREPGPRQCASRFSLNRRAPFHRNQPPVDTRL